MQKDERKKVVLTGGHAASTAFVVFEEIRRQNKNWDLYWIGSKSLFEGRNIPSIASIYFPKYGIKTYEIPAGRLQTRFTKNTLPSLFKIPISFIHALYLLTKIRPSLILSFGGFAAFPIVVVSYFLGIPVIIHEQTSVAGRANRISAPFAKRVAISRKTSKKFFPKRKVVFTGLPTPRGLFKKTPIEKLPKVPSIFITGGQSGSSAINDVIESCLPSLLKDFKVIHQTGLKDENRFKILRNKLDRNLRKCYKVFGTIGLKEFNRIFKSSSIVISRAGANSVSKIVACSKPAILIPIPISYLDEQTENAIYAEKLGISKVLKQEELTCEKLLKVLEFIVKNWESMRKKTKKIENPDEKASEKLIRLMEQTMNEKK